MIDDFFFMAPTHDKCQQHLGALLQLCGDIGVPIAPHKTTQPSTNTTFLGIELDTITNTAKLPADKLSGYANDIQEALLHSKIKRKGLESLVGKLSFASSVVPARPFLRRLINKIYTVKKPYYYIRLSKYMKQDLHTWLTFLKSYNGIEWHNLLPVIENSCFPCYTHVI